MASGGHGDKHGHDHHEPVKYGYGAHKMPNYELQPAHDLNENIPPEHLVAPYGDPNVMLGKGGKLIPKLPLGERHGKMVMGEHGLYYPELRAWRHQLQAAHQAGIPPFLATGYKGYMKYKFALSLAVFCACGIVYNLFSIISGKRPFYVPAKQKK